MALLVSELTSTCGSRRFINARFEVVTAVVINIREIYREAEGNTFLLDACVYQTARCHIEFAGHCE
jgi:hypothetical protein